jgi:hypothetical protein
MTILFRASALSEIMTDPKTKSETLSEGAKTTIEKLAKEYVYGYTEIVTSKYLEKGTIVEPQSLALYNAVNFTDYAKNTERRNNEWLTGECDIFTGSKIIDLKSCWSVATFPAIRAAGMKKEYEWQLRAYMMLWDVDEAELAYCLVNTPDELLGFGDDPALHYVDHIDPALRVTMIPFQREAEAEDKIIAKVKAARIYFAEVVDRIKSEHHIEEE